MTFLQLVQQLYRELKFSGTVPSSVSGQTGQKNEVCFWIAEADKQIQTLWSDWNFLWRQWEHSTVVGTANYSNTNTVGMWDNDSFVLDYDTDTYYTLKYMDYRNWRDTLRNGSKTNTVPRYVTVLPDKSIIIDPPPDDVYTITADYWIAPEKMENDSDTSVIPVKFERIIIARAKMMYAEAYEDNSLAQAAGAEYSLLLSKLQGEEHPGNEPDTLGRVNLVVR